METDSDSDSSPNSAASPSSHMLRQAQMGRELQELNKALAMKQDLAEKMEQNDDQLTIVKLQYEVSAINQQDVILRRYPQRANFTMLIKCQTK